MAIGTQSSKAKKSAKKSRKFTKKVMKTQHQWEALDLEAAGLNRILSLTGTGGSGIATPAAPFISSAQEVAQLAGAAGTAVTSGKQLATAKADVSKAKSEAAMAKTGEQTAKNMMELAKQQTATSAAVEAKTQADTSVTRAKLPRVQAQEFIFNKINQILGATGRGAATVFRKLHETIGGNFLTRPLTREEEE